MSDFNVSSENIRNEIFIGIDGGGSKTNVTALDADGTMLFQGTYGPSNMLNGNEFEQSLDEMFRDLIHEVKDKFKSRMFFHISSGFAGISSEKNAEERFREVLKKVILGYDIIIEKLSMVSDALLALNIYFPDKPGLLLISGTGSICYGKNEKGELFRTGGFGYLIDDGGSAFWFGKKAIQATMYSHFHFDEENKLAPLVMEHFKADEPEDILDIIYKSDHKTAIASACKVVFDAIDSGCTAAEKILLQGTAELVYLVKNCSKLIGDKASYVVLHGSVFKQQLLVDLIKEKLIDDMNIYKSDKRIDLEAANLLVDGFSSVTAE